MQIHGKAHIRFRLPTLSSQKGKVIYTVLPAFLIDLICPQHILILSHSPGSCLFNQFPVHRPLAELQAFAITLCNLNHGSFNICEYLCVGWIPGGGDCWVKGHTALLPVSISNAKLHPVSTAQFFILYHQTCFPTATPDYAWIWSFDQTDLGVLLGTPIRTSSWVSVSTVNRPLLLFTVLVSPCKRKSWA